jgi:hypothetical protein
MIESLEVQLSDTHKNRLNELINGLAKTLNIPFSKMTVGLLAAIEFLILFLIYLYEDFGWSVILKFLTIVPLWFIFSITFLYFRKRLPIQRLFRFYKKTLENGTYEVSKIRTSSCSKFEYNSTTYYVFEVGNHELMVLNQKSFEFDNTIFPSTDFVLPQLNLTDVVGNQILSKGIKLEFSNTKNDIKDLALANLTLHPEMEAIIIQNNA